jgi:predicted ArsR family transcriptional regulator
MMAETQDTHRRTALMALAILRHEPLQSDTLARRLGVDPRTAKRIIATLRDVGQWCQLHGLGWWEIETEIRGRERWHRLVDRPAEAATGRRSRPEAGTSGVKRPSPVRR